MRSPHRAVISTLLIRTSRRALEQGCAFEALIDIFYPFKELFLPTRKFFGVGFSSLNVFSNISTLKQHIHALNYSSKHMSR
jgi:hypothetical protein